MYIIRRTFCTACVILLGVSIAAAQSQDRAFDVASIKPAAPGQRGYSIQPQNGTLKVRNTTLKLLIAEAYHVYDFQVSGGPGWVDGERFDIDAKSEGQPASGAQMR